MRVGEAGQAVLGVDIGGTSIRAGYFSAPGVLDARAHTPLRTWGWPLPVEALAGWLAIHLADWGPVTGVGIAAAAVIEPGTGYVHVGENIGWNEQPVGATLASMLGCPVLLDTDAFCGALAEAHLGSGRGWRDFLYVVVGTAIGHGLVLDGRVHHGMRAAANVFGHIKVVPGGEPCYCGGAGCLCQYAAGKGLARVAQLLSGQPDMTAHETVRKAQEGALWARQAIAQWQHWMALALANAQNLLDLEGIVLGGGVIQPDFPDLDDLRRRVEQLTYPQIRPIEIRRAALGTDSVLHGAAELAFDHHTGSAS